MSAEEYVDQDDGPCVEPADAEEAIEADLIHSQRCEATNEADNNSNSDDEPPPRLPTACEAIEAMLTLTTYLEATPEVRDHFSGVHELLLKLYALDKALLATRLRTSVQSSITRFFVSK